MITFTMKVVRIAFAYRIYAAGTTSGQHFQEKILAVDKFTKKVFFHWFVKLEKKNERGCKNKSFVFATWLICLIIASIIGLHCLPQSDKRDTRLIQ